MIVIIEGLDGVGKTTIAEAFAKKYNYLYVKESYTDDCIEKEKRVQDMLVRLMSKVNFIYDRTTLIDDFVYSFLNKTESTLSQYFDVIKAILSRCKVIHLVIDDETQKQRLEKRGDEYITLDMLKQISKQYYNFYNKLNNFVYFLNLSGDLDQDVQQLMEVIND